jgi:sulfur carrier protein
MNQIQILLNGQPHNLTPPMSLSQLLNQLDIETKGTAIAMDGEVIPSHHWSEFPLEQGLKLQVFHAIAGG